MRFAILFFALAAAPHSGIQVEDMDQTCKPCTDFWQYVNGGWIGRNPIPARLTSWGPMTLMSEGNRERMRSLLESAGGTKMGTLYQSCMDTRAADAEGLKPLQPDFDAISAVRSVDDLGAVIARLQMAPQPAMSPNNGVVAGPFRLIPRPDAKNPERTIAAIVERDSPGGNATSIFSLPDREYYFRNDPKSQSIREEFAKHVSAMMGQPAGNKVLAFETALAESAMKIADRRDPEKTYHPMTAAEANVLTPGFDWKLFLRRMNLPETTPVNVTEPELLKKFGRMLTGTSLDDWKVWLRWRVLTIAAPMLTTALATEDFRFNRTLLNGVTEQLPRWQICANMVDRDMGDALGEAYVKKYFPPEAKRRMGELVENLRSAMRTDLEQSDWMQPETRQSAIRKLQALRVKIGYADRWRDYSDLNIRADGLFENVQSAWAHRQRYALSKIGKATDRNDWGMTPPTVNAYSNSAQVEIAFPAGILQPPIFDMEADDAANYGAIGAVIGHEMGHQFDDSGSKYDSTGMLRNWWTAQDRAKFEARAGCVVEQFDTLDAGGGQHHNGKLVLGEALGDLGGLNVALHAYRISLKGKPAPVIDGFTGEQRFFIAFARVWGSHMRPEAQRVALNTNPHPLAKYRAIATLQNMPEFARAFQCKADDAMVRPAGKQCRLW